MASLPEDRLAQAREFYRERLARSFTYTGSFSRVTRRVAEDVANTDAFAAVVRECALGSLDCARRIGEMAVVHLDGAPAPGPWWRDLCNYERGHFLQAATTDAGPPTNRPRRGTSALCTTFAWDMPKVLEQLKTGSPVGSDLRRNLTLLFARAADGAVRVVEVGPPVEKVFRATNGLRTVEQIAGAAGMSLDETRKILAALAGVGAIAPGKSAEEILQILESQNK
jgi:hypothetical protein